MCRNAFYGGLKAVEACRSLIGAFFFLLQRIDLRFLLLLLWWWFIHLLSTNKPEFLGNKNHEGAVRHLVKRVLNGEQHFRARCHSPLSAWEIKTCVFAFSSLFAVTRKKKNTEALLYVLSSIAFFSLSLFVNVSSKRTPTFVVSLLLFLSALFPLSSLSLSSVLHSWTHTHTHKHARTSLRAKLSFLLIHLLVCIFLFPFTSRFAGTIASPLFAAHTHYHLARLLFYSYTLRQTRYRYYYFFFTVTTIRFHGVIHSP